MECEEQLELTQKALKHVVDEEKSRSSGTASSHDHETSVKLADDVHILPLNLLSQQDDAVKHDDLVEQVEVPKSSQKKETINGVENGNEMIDNQEIIKELREIKKQNTKTHWLLSAMIVLTLTWQLSEATLLWKFKQGITNPFKAIGNMFKRKGGRAEKNDTLTMASEFLSSPSVSNESNE